VEGVSLVDVLSRLLVLRVLFLFLILNLGTLLSFSVRGFVIGVIHSDRAIRKSEGRSSDYPRVSRSALGIQKAMIVADYINSTEEFGNFGSLCFVLIGGFGEQRVGKRRLHVKMQSKCGKGAIELE
jgi:hypothetical protein